MACPGAGRGAAKAGPARRDIPATENAASLLFSDMLIPHFPIADTRKHSVCAACEHGRLGDIQAAVIPTPSITPQPPAILVHNRRVALDLVVTGCFIGSPRLG